MDTGNKIRIIVTSWILGAVLGFVSHFIQNLVIDLSGRNMLGLSGLLYILMAIYFGFWALVLSAIISFGVASSKKAIIATIIVSLVSATWPARMALGVYMERRPDYFDWEYFKADIFWLCSCFVIIPLIGIYAHWDSARTHKIQ